jgi:hypothetical protein
MRVLLGLLAYLAAVVAIVSGAAAVLSSTSERDATGASARSHPTAIPSPRIQIWLERKAEGVAFAEKRRATEQAERERADELRAKLAAAPAPNAAAWVPEAKDRKAAKPERAAAAKERTAAKSKRAVPAKENVRREARRRLRDGEARTAFSYAPQPGPFSYADDFLTRRDRYGY